MNRYVVLGTPHDSNRQNMKRHGWKVWDREERYYIAAQLTRDKAEVICEKLNKDGRE